MNFDFLRPPLSSQRGDDFSASLSKAIISLGILALLLQNLWLADDAAITLRSALNLVHGNGPVFNVGEKVQSFTHPLWFICISALTFLLRDPVLAVFALSLVSTSGTLWVLASRVATSGILQLMITFVLLSSDAFRDFALSGLENPLSALLVALITVRVLRVETSNQSEKSTRSRSWWVLCLLLLMTRLDNALLLLPLLAFIVRSWYLQSPDRVHKSLRRLFSDTAPALGIGMAWFITTTAYYGVFTPNTALAKLPRGLDRGQLFTQGVLYFADSLARDPITLVTISVAIIAAFSTGLSEHRAIMLGVLSYLLYIIWIGGDFMSGRFFATPLVASGIVLVDVVQRRATRTLSWSDGVAAFAIISLAILLPVASPSARILDSYSTAAEDPTGIPANGIADEKGFYDALNQSPLTQSRDWFDVSEWGRVEPAFPREVRETCGGLGALGLSLGPAVYVLDSCALVDPFLSRKAPILQADWRIGHLMRALQPEYIEYRRFGSIDNSGTQSFIDEIAFVERFTTGSTFDLQRFWRGIRETVSPTNLTPAYSTVRLSELAHFNLEGMPWDAAGTFDLSREPLKVTVDPRSDQRPTTLRLLLDSNDRYCVQLFHRNDGRADVTPSQTTCLDRTEGSGLSFRTVVIKRRAPLDYFVVTEESGDGRASIGAAILEFLPNP